MTKTLLVCLFIGCFTACRFTSEKKGQVFVNQQLIENTIQQVQPSEHIELSIQTTNDHDSTLIVKLNIDSKIPDSSLNGSKAKEIMSSFLTILPDLKTFTFCKIIFVKTKGGAVSTSRSVEFLYRMLPELAKKVENFKDSTRASVGYIDPTWTYINRDLNLSLKMQSDWFYASEEHDSLVFYAIGSDINELPQYRTDTDRKVTFTTLSNLDPGSSYAILQLSRNKIHPADSQHPEKKFPGPLIFLGLNNNLFGSEDEYLKNLYELIQTKRLSDTEIHTFRFGNTDFRGHPFSRTLKDGSKMYILSVIKRYKSVTLLLSMKYSNDKEFDEIKHELSGLTINKIQYMKNKCILLGLLIIAGLFSCSKSNDPAPASSALPKTYTEDIRSSVFNSVTTYNLTYDGKNRLISLAAIPEPSVVKFIYQYPNANTVTMDMYNSGQLSIHENFWLNASSFIDSTFQYNDTQDTSTEKYVYDANHLLMQINNYDYHSSSGSLLSNQTNYTYDNNGNALTQSDNQGTISFTYFPDLVYSLSIGQPYIPVPKNFIKTASTTSGGTPVTVTHFYTFDSNNRLTKDSAYASGIDVIAVKTYTY